MANGHKKKNGNKNGEVAHKPKFSVLIKSAKSF